MKANWLRAAITDDSLVAELLLLLHRSDSSHLRPALPLPPLGWGIRQPRSRPSVYLNKECESSWRRSPTTPLSWTASGAGSPGDSREESSRPVVLAARFKGAAITDTTNSVSASKRSRRKRTFSELKEDENSLLNEKEHLKKQIESLHKKLEEQRLFNESLKSIKIDLHAQSATLNVQMGLSRNNGAPEREASTSRCPSKTIKSEETLALRGDYCPVLNGSSTELPHFFELPDLNMTPDSILEMS